MSAEAHDLRGRLRAAAVAERASSVDRRKDGSRPTPDFRCITPASDEWPVRLRELAPHVPPERLFVAGCPLDAGSPIVAVVGTRRPTAAGVEAAQQLTKALVEAGVTIVSGLAIGIDAIAHRTAVELGGYTIAVLGSGLDVDYPQRNRRLKEDIRRTGTIVTEHAAGIQPLPHHFPERNRIVAGLAQGVLIIEGGLKSGALITARMALDANRHVWAVPGSLRNAMAVGPNYLIRSGQASLTTQPAHVFEDIAPALVWEERQERPRAVVESLTDDERTVLEVLDDVPVSPDRVIRLTGLSPGAAALALSRLEVRGHVTRRLGGYEVSGSGGRLRFALGERSNDAGPEAGGEM